MQSEAPEVLNITKEPEAVRGRYGDHDFGRGCLMARRLVEHGVRMVQVYYGNGQPWDNHDDILIHRKLAHDSDGPIAALLADLKASGLLKETLVIIGGEFGRTPVLEVSGLVRRSGDGCPGDRPELRHRSGRDERTSALPGRSFPDPAVLHAQRGAAHAHGRRCPLPADPGSAGGRARDVHRRVRPGPGRWLLRYHARAPGGGGGARARRRGG